MISIFNQLFSNLTDTLTTSYSDIKTSSVFTNTPSSYPFVSVEEINNSIYEKGIDGCHIENFVNLDYELNIYTKGATRKTNADKILSTIDNYMSGLGFERTNTYRPPESDETVYRITVRYRGVCSTNKIIYRR